MKFTYIAPKEYNDHSQGYKTVESEYLGPHDFKVYVDTKTRLIVHGVEFDHDGHPDVHDGSDNSRDPSIMEMVYLHSHNPNHIALMAMITNHEGHKTVNTVEVVCEKYNMVYQRLEHPSLDHTYDLRKITIDQQGIVTYPWWKLDVDYKMLVTQGKGYRSQLANRLLTEVLTDDEKAKLNYSIEIIDYVILNKICEKQPWKIAWPNPDTVTLDNSMPIGMPDGVPNADRDFEATTAWGAVPHELPYHMDGDDVVVDTVCPTTAEDAAKLQPWTELTADHPTHSTAVAMYAQVQQSLIDSNPDIQLTTDLVQAAYNQQLAQQAALAAPATPAVDPTATPAP